MVQTRLTVSGSGSKRDLLNESSSRDVAGCSGRIAEGDEPVRRGRDPAAGERGGVLVPAARRDAMIVVDDQQGQQAGGEGTMHRQVGPEHAVPGLGQTTRTGG